MAAQVADIIPLLHANNLPPHVEVISEGSKGEAIYFLASGVVKMRGRSGEQHLGAGEVFGVAATLSNDKHAASFVTASRARLLKLYRDDLSRIAAANPAVGTQIRALAQRTGEASQPGSQPFAGPA